MNLNSVPLIEPAPQQHVKSCPSEEGFVRRQREHLTPDEISLVEDRAFRFGDSPESYFATEPHSEILFWNGGKALVPLYADRRCWHVPGGIFAPDECKKQVISALYQEARKQKVTLTVFSVNDDDRLLYKECGYQVTKFGEEPYLDLSNLTWSGKAFEWVRRQTNYCRRQGLTFREILPPGRSVLPASYSEECVLLPDRMEWERLKDELTAVQFEDLEGRAYDKPLRLMEGQLFLEKLYRRRVFVALGPDGVRLEAFCIANPMRDGKAWAIEMYRKRKDSPRGTIPYLIREVVDQLGRELADSVSLCLIPGRGLDRRIDGDCQWATILLRLWHWLSPKAFNLAGQEHFKTRFRPRFQNRYMAVTPKASLESMCSFLNSTGALDISLWKFLRGCVKRS